MKTELPKCLSEEVAHFEEHRQTIFSEGSKVGCRDLISSDPRNRDARIDRTTRRDKKHELPVNL